MLNLEPIGFVRNDIERSTDFSDVVSEIVVNEDLTEGLYRIEESKEIDVIFWFDRSLPTRMRLHPKGNPNEPLVGVFASRSPNRPNPIGVTRVQLIAIMGNILTVKGLDAFNGTPVLDIKPAGCPEPR
jgi:tRNA-Thr(GGU) m(6)t(6)A37 methyltransferase TsaA